MTDRPVHPLYKTEVNLQGLSTDDINDIRFSLRILGYHQLDMKLARMLRMNSARLLERQEIIESQRTEIQRQNGVILDVMAQQGGDAL